VSKLVRSSDPGQGDGALGIPACFHWGDEEAWRTNHRDFRHTAMTNKIKTASSIYRCSSSSDL